MGEPLEEFSSTRKCASCGKLITVLWPQQWAYKRGTPGHEKYYLCSWKCLRLFDKAKEEKERRHMGAPRIISDEQEKEAVRIALEGGDPLRYLEECGSNIPPQTWYRIKQKLKDTDPETYEKLPKRIQRKDAVQKPVETPEGEFTVTMEAPEPAKIRKPVNYDGMTVRAVSGTYGTYYLDNQTRSGITYLDYSNAGGDELSMEIIQWRLFIKELKHAAEILGVEL